jgi:hypothetical protein
MTSIMSRRSRNPIIFAVVVLVLVFSFFMSRDTPPPLPMWETLRPILPEGQTLRISIVETIGAHDEVVAALVNAWGQLPGAEISLYQALPRFGSHAIMDTFSLTNPLPKARNSTDFQRWNELQPIPDVLISTTCEHDTHPLSANLTTLLNEHNTYLYCVFHHADRWFDVPYFYWMQPTLVPWIKQGRMEFVGLSTHTGEFIRKNLMKWDVFKDPNSKLEPLIRTLPPVYPVKLPLNPKPSELSFGIQGDFGDGRRDYTKIFAHLQEFLDPKNKKFKRDPVPAPSLQARASRNVSLHLVGHGDHPKVPENLKQNVIFDEGLDYIDFYAILSRTFAMLPAFGSDEYLDRKASSTIPASLIAGTPLVATREIVNAYSYLSDDMLWLQSPGESEFEVVSRALAMTDEQRAEKTNKVRRHNEMLIERNVRAVRNWTEEAFSRIGRETHLSRNLLLESMGRETGEKPLKRQESRWSFWW